MTGKQQAPTTADATLARGAQQLEQSAEVRTDSADRRTELAASRTILAAERTYAAWVRTGLAALASGVGARALLDKIVPDWLIGATASLLVLFSGFCFMAAVWRQGTHIPHHPDAKQIPPWLLRSVNGFLMIVSLAALVGMWLQ